MKDKYIFPAIFQACEEGGYCVTFPDLPGCITEGDTMEEAFYMAKDALLLHLWCMEDEGDIIPEPTLPDMIQVIAGGFVSLVEVWMPSMRDKMANKAVNKTLTLPKWLNDLAEQEKVNFSYILQNALKQYLGVSEYRPAIKK
ncbi:type II toxin-antitoxin system HicB family antitoxin [Desulforamulus aquiferis]|uniref:Type II toxin-antitoxin system HicB family antitoxin n=1 Tax=Desulforamulus aquiferis TaxID=1397668 RepID=A0AAW7ZGW3_9FIRM|nr:type II toxin-antitoxin system HicB family antitoxin [Desulforamulus aquiferis]MDO7788671.1 type II toxin-antitoxin system HicB family antitoxin [Desulforamulus aquiferis]RYD05322.1 pilus biosynthesis protein HicB [Desulforamulus aquiferis]